MKILLIFFLLVAIHSNVPLSYAQDLTPAFPTAEGYGKYAQGGRGGRVIEVTNLNCTGSGSFFEALEASGPRTVVFKVGGIIDCTGHPFMYVKNPYLTIAGQTAPGDGILLKGVTFIVNAHNSIIRYMQFRMGEKVAGNKNSANVLGLTYTHDVIADHVSVSWGTDDTAVMYEAFDATWQWSIISEGLHCAADYCQSKGLINGYNSPTKTSIHHNLFASSSDRNPILATGHIDVINNLQHNVGGNAMQMDPHYSPLTANIVGNYVSRGPISPNYAPYRLGANQACCTAKSLAYFKNNIDPVFRRNNSLPELSMVMFTDGPPHLPTTTTRISSLSYTSETDAFQAYDDVLADAGDNKRLNADGTFSPRRGPVDTRIIDEVKAGKGGLIFHTVNEVGGFPVMKNGTPYADADHDGMSDVWEDKYVFNKADATDGSQDSDGDGYTNLEEFLNGTNPLLKTTFQKESLNNLNQASANLPVIDTTPPTTPKGIEIF